MKRLLLLAALVVCGPANAQVRQSGNVTNGHAASWTASGVIQDAGSAANPNVTTFGVRNPGPGICQNSNVITGPYLRLCLSTRIGAPGQITFDALNGASEQDLQFVVNGNVVTLPSSGTFVFTNREINTGLGLTGGGDLSADRTISMLGTLPNSIQDNITRLGTVTTGAVPFSLLTSTPTTLAGYGITNALVTTNNLDDLTNAAAARSSLGLGSIATQAASNVTITGGTITGMPNPSVGSDVANKTYVDAAVSTGTARISVPVGTTGNVNLSGGGLANGVTIDGQTLSTGQFVLVLAQSAPAENGIYTVPASGAASRTTGYTTYANFVGLSVIVTAGTANAHTLWFSTAQAGGTIGVTAITFSEVGSSGVTSIGGVNGVITLSSGLYMSGSQLTSVWDQNGDTITNNTPGNVCISVGHCAGGFKLDVVGTYGGTSIGFNGFGLGLQNFSTTNNSFAEVNFSTADTGATRVEAAKIATVFTSHSIGAVSSQMSFLTMNAGTIAEQFRISPAGVVSLLQTTNCTGGLETNSTGAIACGPDLTPEMFGGGTGVSDNMVAFQAVATACRAAGSCTIRLQCGGTYTVFATTPVSGVVLFDLSHTTGAVLDGCGATITTPLDFNGTNTYALAVHFLSSKNGTVRNLNVVSTAPWDRRIITNGWIGVDVQDTNTNIRVENFSIGGTGSCSTIYICAGGGDVAFRCVRTTSADRSTGIVIENLHTDTMLYGIAAEKNCDNLFARGVNTIKAFRSYIVYNVWDHDVDIHSDSDGNGGQDVEISNSYDGSEDNRYNITSDIRVNYTSRGAPGGVGSTGPNAFVNLTFQTSGGSSEGPNVTRNIDVHVDIQNRYTNYATTTFQILNQTSTPQGRLLENITLSGATELGPNIDYSCCDFFIDKDWTGDNIRNFNLINYMPLNENSHLVHIRIDGAAIHGPFRIQNVIANGTTCVFDTTNMGPFSNAHPYLDYNQFWCPTLITP